MIESVFRGPDVMGFVVILRGDVREGRSLSRDQEPRTADRVEPSACE